MEKAIRKIIKASACALGLLVAMPAQAQYCTTTYSSSQCINYSMYINSVITTGGKTNIKRTNSGCGNTSTSYIFYSKDVHAGVQGTKVNFEVTIGAEYPQGVRIYVDFNRDGDFTDKGEDVYVSSGAIAKGGTAKGNFTIPAEATVGTSRMRIRTQYSNTSFNSCGSASYGEAEDYVFEILPSCTADFTLQPLHTSECDKTAAKFFVEVNNFTDSIKWQRSTGGTFKDIDDDLIYSGTESDTLTVNNISFNMMGDRFRAVAYNNVDECNVKSEEADLTVIPSDNASVNITSSATSICDGDEVTVNCFFTKGGNNPEYQWKVNGNDILGETKGSLKTTSLADGDKVSLYFLSSQVCIFPATSNEITVNVDPKQKPSVELSMQNNGGGQFTFTATPMYGGSNPVYQWYVNNVRMSGETGDTYVATNLLPKQKVHAEMISNMKCVTTRRVYSNTVTTTSTTSVSNISQGVDALGLYPNPTTGDFIISGEVANTTNQNITVRIVNTVGKTVQTINATTNGSTLSVPVSLEYSLPNGMYSASITIDNKVHNVRFLLNR